MTASTVSDEHAAAYVAIVEAQKARASAEGEWRPHILMVHPDGEQVINFYTYDEALAWLNWNLVNLQEIPEGERPKR